MPDDDKDTKKQLEDMQKKIESQRKELEEMMKIAKKNKDMAEVTQLISSIIKKQDDVKKAIINNLK